MPYIGIDFGTSNSVVANFQFGHAEVLAQSRGAKMDPFRRDHAPRRQPLVWPGGQGEFRGTTLDSLDQTHLGNARTGAACRPKPAHRANRRHAFLHAQARRRESPRRTVCQGGHHHPRQFQGPRPPRHQAVRRRRRHAGSDAHQRTHRGRHLLWPQRPTGPDRACLRFRRRHAGRDHSAHPSWRL